MAITSEAQNKWTGTRPYDARHQRVERGDGNINTRSGREKITKGKGVNIRRMRSTKCSKLRQQVRTRDAAQATAENDKRRGGGAGDDGGEEDTCAEEVNAQRAYGAGRREKGETKKGRGKNKETQKITRLVRTQTRNLQLEKGTEGKEWVGAGVPFKDARLRERSTLICKQNEGKKTKKNIERWSS